MRSFLFHGLGMPVAVQKMANGPVWLICCHLRYRNRPENAGGSKLPTFGRPSKILMRREIPGSFQKPELGFKPGCANEIVGQTGA